MPGTIRWRLLVSYVVLITLVVGGLSAFLFSFIRNNFYDTAKNSLRAEARLLAQQTTSLFAGGQPGDTLQSSPALNQLVHQYANQLGERVTIIRPDGNVISDSEFDASTMENHLNRPEVQKAVQGQEFSIIRYSTTAKRDMLYSAVPIFSNTRVIGISRLSVSISQEQSSLNIIGSSFLAISLIAMVLAVILAVLVSNYTSKPLRELTSMVRDLAKGNSRTIEMPVPTDEVGQLERTFLEMANRVNLQLEELRTERSRLSAVLTRMNDGILIIDHEGNVQLINPAAQNLFHIQEEEALGRSLIEVARSHQLVDLWQKCQSTRAQQTTTLETSPDRWFFQAIATPLAETTPDSILMVVQDLTRLRRLEMVRRDFVSNVSHELRTPLASLKALTETLMEGALEDPPAAKGFLIHMDQEIDNLTQMVRELLELSKIESGRVPLQKSTIGAYELAFPAVERMQLQAERAGLTLQLEVPDGLPEVNADPDRIEQVWVNLIHNAIKFTPPGGKIVVGAYRDPLKVIFFVQDTGVGISPEALPRIFERFYKADRSRSGGGTGLGLSICRHLVEAHNGRIWAESTVGQGSTFYFSIPIS